MGAALIFGLIGSSALVIGGAIGAYWRAPQRISGVLLAFASGTLISALAFELFPEAVHLGGLWPAGLGLIAGGLTFVVISTLLDSWVAQSAGDPYEVPGLPPEAAEDVSGAEQTERVQEAATGGAVLASLADTLMPEAFEHGRPLNSMATAAGFLLSFILSGLPLRG
jgi:zinc transporter, ZIP family